MTYALCNIVVLEEYLGDLKYWDLSFIKIFKKNLINIEL